MLTEVLDPRYPHLGGNSIENNPHTFCPEAWAWVIQKYKIKSVLDVGSGRGHAALWFRDQGLEVTAIEGLPDNVAQALVPTQEVDLTQRAYRIDVDLVNCIEVVEHVDAACVNNVMDTLCSGRWVFMTHGLPRQRGHHHINNQLPQYWIDLFQQRGYDLVSSDLSEIRRRAGTASHVRKTAMLFQRR